MAVPTSAQCKLQLSFDMVAKTMTVSMQTVLETWVLLTYTPSGATIVNPLGDSVDITDIDVQDGSGTFSQTFPAPVDRDGNVINGAYNIKIPSLLVNDDTGPVTYTDVDSSYTLNYTKNTISITQEIKCSNPASFVSTDETVWNQFNPDGSTVAPASGANYAHNLNYPVGSLPPNGISPPTETSDISITRGPREFFNGTQTSSVTRDLTWTFADGLVVTDTTFGTKEILVDCDNQMCSITCGENKLYDTWLSNVVVNTSEAQKNQNKFILTMCMAMLGQMNINCGNPQKATEIANKVKVLLGDCCNDCAAATGTPVTGY